MNQQIASSASNLKRQLIFLKTIDQKLEGLRRENERLLRLSANPRVVFSRSSLAGLYRIVNSLMSSGPMYGLADIGQWAQKNKDWLVAFGRKGDGPAQEDLDYLLEAANELARLRDEASAEVEKKLSEAKGSASEEARKSDSEPQSEQEADEVPEPERSASDKAALPVETDVELEESSAPEKNEDSSPKEALAKDEGFPFTDEPKAQSINDSSFAPKATGNKKAPPRKAPKGRDRTSTIPLAVDELNMIGTTSMIPPGVSAPKDKGGFWKVFALLSFAGFAVMTGLYIREIRRPIPEPPKPASVAVSSAAHREAASPGPKASDKVENADETKKANLEETKEQKPEPASKGKEKSASKKDEDKDKGKDKDRKKDRRKKDRHREKKESSSASKSESSGKPEAAARPKGMLHVKPPADGSEVFVLVDGVSKGKAPVKTALSPGLHEVVFTSGGRRSMRMIPIRADSTKTVVATNPN